MTAHNRPTLASPRIIPAGGAFLRVVLLPVRAPCDGRSEFGRPSGSFAFVRPLRLLWAPSVGRNGGAWSIRLGQGEAVEPGPQEGNRMAYATAMPRSRRGPESRFA